MSKTPPNAVQLTGAHKGDILEGLLKSANRGLSYRFIQTNQKTEIVGDLSSAVLLYSVLEMVNILNTYRLSSDITFRR